MPLFAEVNPITGEVYRVVSSSPDCLHLTPTSFGWVETFQETDQALNPRKNFAGVGYQYDPVRNAFISPQPFPSWTLDESTCQWQPPTPMPLEGVTRWDEDTLNWVPVV